MDIGEIRHNLGKNANWTGLELTISGLQALGPYRNFFKRNFNLLTLIRVISVSALYYEQLDDERFNVLFISGAT